MMPTVRIVGTVGAKTGRPISGLPGGRGMRRVRVAGGSLAVGLVAGWAMNAVTHGTPDPGGRSFARLQTVLTALPRDAQVILQQASEPQWTSCDGRAGTSGWTPVTISTQFRTHESPAELLATAGRRLAAAGWSGVRPLDSPLGPGARWTHPVGRGARATVSLTPATMGGATAPFWDLTAVAPPRGRQASGC